MKNVKVTLKKISFYERMSEETNCFAANLYINGKLVGEAKNDGQGGCTTYYGNSKEDNEIIRQAEAYFKSLPMVKPDGYTFTFQPSLEYAIDEQFEAYLKAKEEKKMLKLMEKAVLFGKPNANQYHIIKTRKPLKEYPETALQKFIDDVKKQHCTDGVIILNKNLEKLGITI